MLKRITDKPILPLPANAVQAKAINHLKRANHPYDTEYGIFVERRDILGQACLMTWGTNINREDVQHYNGHKFVWVSLCSDGTGKLRDNFEAVL